MMGDRFLRGGDYYYQPEKKGKRRIYRYKKVGFGSVYTIMLTIHKFQKVSYIAGCCCCVIVISIIITFFIPSVERGETIYSSTR